MTVIPTVLIRTAGGGMARINADEYDPAVHGEVVSEGAPPAAEDAAPSAEQQKPAPPRARSKKKRR